MNRACSFICLFILLPCVSLAQTLRLMTKLPAQVNETSGIELSSSNKVWTFNDSGGANELYLCDTLGNLIRTVSIQGSWNRDWEDLAQDDQGNFYIGNIGNNSNSQTDLSIFKIPNPDNVPGNSVTAELITFSYEDQTAFPPADNQKNFDCETLFWANGNLYLCSKNRTVPFDGMTYLYRLSDSPGNHVATKIGEFDTDGYDTFDYWITAGDVSPDGTKLCLLSSDKMWVFYDFQGDDYFGGKHTQINFPSSTQKEAIVFVDNETVYITDEDWGTEGRNLYSLRLPVFEGPFNGVIHNVPGAIEAEAYDYGGNGIGYYDLTSGNEGGQFRTDDVDIESNSDQSEGYNVGWFEMGEWLQFSIDVQFDGDYELQLRTASEVEGQAYIEIDQVKVGESFNIESTGGWKIWQSTAAQTYSLTKGEHTLRLIMESGGFNLNYLEFSSAVTAVEMNKGESGFMVYPNPAQSDMFVESVASGRLVVYGASGNVITSVELETGQTGVVKGLPAGVYVFTFSTGEEVLTQRVLMK